MLSLLLMKQHWHVTANKQNREELLSLLINLQIK